MFAARSLGFLDRTAQECIDLMDLAKESYLIEVLDHHGVRWEESYGFNSITPVTGITGRQYLQNVGNEGRKLFGDTFWIDQVLPQPSGHPARDVRDVENEQRLVQIHNGAEILCITDLRYENEAQRVKALGGVVWEVIRPGTASDGHASEQPLPRELVDLQIDNSGSLSDLRWVVDKALEGLLDI